MLEFNAIFDSGTSYTHLSDPYYTFITENVSNLNDVLHRSLELHFMKNSVYMIYVILQFNSNVKEKRNLSDSQIPFEYCYNLRYVLGEKHIPILY